MTENLKKLAENRKTLIIICGFLLCAFAITSIAGYSLNFRTVVADFSYKPPDSR